MTLHVTNIHFAATSEDLTSIFSEFGEVVSAEIVIDKVTGHSKGFLVKMSSEAAGRQAISHLNGTMIEGHSLKVTEARPRN